MTDGQWMDYYPIRPEKINVLFPISSPICHRVGRLATFFFSLLFFFQVKLWLVNRNFFLMES